MRATLIVLLLVTSLAACNDTETLPTVEALAADPVRLAMLRDECRLDHAKLGDALCNRVAEATRKRFFGDGKVPYTPPKKPPSF